MACSSFLIYTGATSEGLCDESILDSVLVWGDDTYFVFPTPYSLYSAPGCNGPDLISGPFYFSYLGYFYYYSGGTVVGDPNLCPTTTTTTTLPPVDYFVGCGEVVDCENGFVEFGPSDDPDDIFNTWNRFAFFAGRTILFSPIPLQNTGLQPDGSIITNNPSYYFYTGATNTYYLGELNIPMTEGEDVGPGLPSSYPLNTFYYNTVINKFVTAFRAYGTSVQVWTTFNPTANVSIPLGNPTAAQGLTTSTNWSTTNLTSTQYTVSGLTNTVVLASNKINDAGGVPKMIQCSLNSGLVNGFYSVCAYGDYTHEITIGSTDSDDDTIGIVLAANKGLGTNPEVTDYLSLSFNGNSQPGNLGRAFVYYNSGQDIYAFNNGSTTSSQVMSGVTSPFGNGDYNTKGQVRVRIVKTGNIIEIYTTSRMGLFPGAIQPGQPNPYTLLFQFDLTDINTWTGAPNYAVGDELLKFTGSTRIGYLTASQSSSQFYDIFLDGFQQPSNSLFSNTTSGVVLGNVYTFEEVSGCWEYSGQTSNYETLTPLTVESEFNDCSVCNEEPPQCPFESYCVSTGNIFYDGTYYSAGTYNDQTFWTGETNNLLIFLSPTENCWCLSTDFADPCLLFGPSPCNNDCPDLCDGFFNPGVCPTPTPTPTQYCQTISFEAAFDCDLPITPTPTPTPTKTLTPTPTPTATELCGGRAMSINVVVYTPTPTPTATGGKMVPTPTASPQYNCNFDGSVVFNTFDDYIRCNGSKRFKDCVSGMLYHTTDVVLDPFGGTPAEGYVYQSFVDGISTCISYEGFVSNIAGVNTINLTSILGKLIDGACSQCVIINTPTPTPTLTSTPTPTASSPLPTCNNYLIENSYIQTQTFSYTSCITGLPVDGVLDGYGSTTICSSTLPTTTSSFISITNIGLCNPTPTPTSTSVTPTPTPTQGVYVPTCSLIFNTNSPYYYSYDLSTNISTELGVIPISTDIAHTQNKLWVTSGGVIKEYDITLSPWSLTFNRDITQPYPLGSGMGAVSNTKLLSSNGSTIPAQIIELDITTNNAVPTILFTLSSDRVVSGDLLLTTTGKVLVTSVSYNPTFKTFLSQYDYSTGTLEVDVEITNFTPYPYGIFQSSGLLYITNVDGNVYNIPLNAPHTPVYVQTIQTGGGGYSVFGASQVPNCLTVNLNV
jgi:hypothetical protein